MTLKLHNTLTGKIEDFSPQNKTDALVYSCGPTVYNDLHVGNWSAYIYWDVLIRLLQANQYDTKYVINITDVGHLTDDADDGEDKLEAGAKREGKDAWQIAEKYSESFFAGRHDLNILPPTKFSKATDYILQQLEMIRTLKNKGYLYQISDGLYFDTAKFPQYSDFAHLNLEAQQAGARVTFNKEKRNPSDFAVWKFSPTDKKRDMEWVTPTDLLDNESEEIMGFPGWHIECSAIVLSELGQTIDIHTGGIDHIPVHHTNEIAQSQTANQKPLANYWLHNNHMKSDGVKISKSLQNGYTLSDLAEKSFTPADFRLFVLQSHYQSESNFTFANLESAANRLKKWRQIACLRHQSYETLNQTNDDSLSFYPEPKLLLDILNNNLNTPEALSFVDQTFNKIDASHKRIDQESFVFFLETIEQLLGIDLLKSTPDIDDETKQLLIERRNVRETEDWVKADEIRKTLTKKGVAINDTSKGSFWYYA